MSETQWASDQLMLQVDKHTRGLETHASFDPRQNCLVLVAWLPKTSFCIQVEIRLVTKSLSETVFVRMCVIIWEELRGSCWEDICVRAWHLTLDLWMEFTHTHTHTHTLTHSLTHSFQLPRRDHCHCYAASVLIDTDWWDLNLCCSYAKDNIRRKRQYACWKMNERNHNAEYNRFRNGNNQTHFCYKYICKCLYKHFKYINVL